MEIQGKTALITGAAKRIGRAIALLLAEEGMDLLLHYHRSKREALRTRKEAEDRGVRVELFQADLNQFSEVRGLIRSVFRSNRRISVLINNASIFYKTPPGRIPEKDWDSFFNVNLKAPFFLAEAAGFHMARRREGKIINLIDWTAFHPHPDYLPYAASKAALAAVTQGLARAFAPHIQVNGIAAGPVLPARGSKPKDLRKIITRTPLKRFGEPRDIAETVRFLVKATDFITGAVIPVDGGNLIA